MLKCECDRCHSAMEVPSVMMPFMQNPEAKKSEFMIFGHDDRGNMVQINLCTSCEEAFKTFLSDDPNVPTSRTILT